MRARVAVEGVAADADASAEASEPPLAPFAPAASTSADQRSENETPPPPPTNGTQPPRNDTPAPPNETRPWDPISPPAHFWNHSSPPEHSYPQNETPPRNDTTPPSPNGTRPPAGNHTTPGNNTTLPPPRLAPREQIVTTNTTHIEFRLTVTNPANVPQEFWFSTQVPATSRWIVQLAPWNATLAAGESIQLAGTIDAPPLAGRSGTLVVQAYGASGSDTALVHACFRSVLQPCPVTNSTNGTSPPTNDTRMTNQTSPPPPGNGTRPPQNETSGGTSNATSSSQDAPPRVMTEIPPPSSSRDARIEATGRVESGPTEAGV